MKNINTISANEYAQAFRAIDSKIGRDLLEAHLAAPDYTTTWQDLAEAVGMKDGRAVNVHYGKFAREVAELLGFVEPPKPYPEAKRGFWLFTLVKWADHWGSRGHTAFVLRKPIIQALREGTEFLGSGRLKIKG
jgi:hypothetical protein